MIPSPSLRISAPRKFWLQHREASRNWIALGLLLAAWNASDNESPNVQRPEALRGYPQVSVRAVTHHLIVIKPSI